MKLLRRRDAPLITPTGLSADATRDIGGTMNAILADVIALYLKLATRLNEAHGVCDEHRDIATAWPMNGKIPPGRKGSRDGETV